MRTRAQNHQDNGGRTPRAFLIYRGRVTLFAGVATGLAMIAAGAATPAAVFPVTNAGDQPRPLELASLPWPAVLQRVPGLTAETAAVREAESKQDLTVQVFDRDADGRPDELLFPVTLGPRETRRYEVYARDAPGPADTPARVGARFAPEHRSDMAWENNRMAYRLYGPKHNDKDHAGGVDVWSKRTRDPILEAWYRTGQKGDYKVDLGQGCDCTSIGAGPGCGGTAYRTPAGEIVVSPVFETWKIIAAGPLRAEVELVHLPLTIGPATITETRRITCDLGAALFKIQSSFAVKGDAGGITPLAGLKSNDPAGHSREGVATAWLVADRGEKINGKVGLGLILPRDGQALPGPHRSVYFPLADDLVRPAVWHAGATWSKALDCPTPEEWMKELQATKARLAAPLNIGL